MACLPELRSVQGPGVFRSHTQEGGQHTAFACICPIEEWCRGSSALPPAQREVGRKLYARLPELSQLLDATLARAPKEQFGAPSPAIWQRMVVGFLLLFWHCLGADMNMQVLHAIA